MVEVRPPTTHSDQPRVTAPINVNYCVPQCGMMTMAQMIEILVDNFQTLSVNCFVADDVSSVTGRPQKKGLSPIIVKQERN